MRFDQYSNVLTLAAALSMAGWVARTPDSNQVPFDNNQYSANQNSVYNHYSQNQISNQQWAQEFQQHGQGPILEQAVPRQGNIMEGRSALYQSKDAEETFRAYLELQELISWHESYRRGDYPVRENNQQYVMPVVSNNEFDLEEILDHSGNDDGYATGSSIGSPASSTISNEIGNLSPVNPENSNILNVPFFEINNHRERPICIDNLFGNNMSPEMPFPESEKAPYSKLLSSLDDELDYINSPSALKNPSVDSFLTKQSPEYNPPYTFTNNKFDDPFSGMTFMNSSTNNRFASDTLVDMADYNPIFNENSNHDKEDEMLDDALVQALSLKGKKETPGAVKIKQKDEDWLSPSSPMVEHDYFNRDDIKPVTSSTHLINKHRPQSVGELTRTRFTPFPASRSRSFSANNRSPRGRTFAPSHTVTRTTKHKNVHTKTKLEKSMSNILWNDFPYTSNQLVEMPVEKFNEIIKQLDEIRQHIAKDERRKGKNKLAARNCRKRKMDIIDDLDQGVSGLEQKRHDLLNERKKILEETMEIKRKTEWLNNYIFEYLRDSNGLPYSQTDFSLQYTTNGNVYVVPSLDDKERRI